MLKNSSLYIIIILLVIIVYQYISNKEKIVDEPNSTISYPHVEKPKKQLVEDVVESDKIEEQLSDSEALFKAKQSLNLSKIDENDVLTVWSIDTDSIILKNGEINTEVKLIATLSKNELKDNKIFRFDIPKTSVEERLEQISQNLTANSIKLTNESLDNIVTNLNLPSSGARNSFITWSSSDESIISNRGIVVRPSFNKEDAVVTLTATISKNGIESSKEFTVTVIADESDIRVVK